jgi:6-pyruvoyl-tetrahydropterin synthase
MQLELVLLVTAGPDGMATNCAAETLEFGDMKKKFREHIDTTYDHHLILNNDDPWAQVFDLHDPLKDDPIQGKRLPGLVTVEEDPTVENLAKWIAEWAAGTYKCDAICRLEETKTNGAEVMYHWNGFGTHMVRGAI